MTWADRLSEISTGVVTGTVLAVGSGAAWLFRIVFTNQQQVKELRREIDRRDRLRDEDREDLKEVKEGLRTITHHLITRSE